MNLQSVKKPSDFKLNGIAFDCEYRDKQLAAVTLRDDDGHIVRFALENYSVKAYVPAPPEKKTVHVVSGTVRGIGTTIREEFDDELEATRRHNDIVRADVCADTTITTEEVEVPY